MTGYRDETTLLTFALLTAATLWIHVSLTLCADARIQYVRPNKVRYRRYEAGTVRVGLENTASTRARLRLSCEIIKELHDTTKLATPQEWLCLGPGVQTAIDIPFVNDATEFGREVRVSLIDDSNATIDTCSEYFSVADNIFKVYVAGGGYSGPNAFVHTPTPSCHFPIWWSPEAQQEWDAAHPYFYGNYWERFAWAPGEQMDLTPDKDEWFSGQTRYECSKQTLKGQIEAMQRKGVACIAYVNQSASGPAGFEVYRKHPEWFPYGEDGLPWAWFDAQSVALWDMPWSMEEFAERASLGWYGLWPNWRVKEARDHAINELIETVKIFGWDGFRWDCGQFDAFTRLCYFDGRVEEISEQRRLELTAQYVREMKQKVRSVFPHLVFGYNMGIDPHDPLLAECAKDGGLIMEEGTSGFYEPTSPFHRWKDYARYLCQHQAIVHALGGFYNPFIQEGGGASDTLDQRYESILQLAARSHPHGLFYYHDFITRYSCFLWDDHVWPMPEPGRIIEVSGNAELWWEDQSAYRLYKNHLQYVLPLINPPYSEAIDENVAGLVNPPVHVTMRVVIPEGYDLAEVWLLTGDYRPWAYQLQPTVDGTHVTIVLPLPVKFWSIVVCDFIVRISSTKTFEYIRIPHAYVLEPNWPNPFNAFTHIQYGLPKNTFVRLSIYDALGRVVRTLVEEEQPPGYYAVPWDGTNSSGALVPSGMYFYQLNARGFSQTRKMSFLK